MLRLYSYIVKHDSGSAPNPFWGVCTLTICKPKIRQTAKVGDWIIGTGSKNTKLKDGAIHDLSGCLVYAMKVSDKKSMKEYEDYCQASLPDKIPKWFGKDWRRRLGDCIYDFSEGEVPSVRKSVHAEHNREKDLSGGYALLSNHFYYFGEEPRPIPAGLKKIVKKTQGHLVFEEEIVIRSFEKWVKKYRKNKLYADPQRKYLFEILARKEDLKGSSPEFAKSKMNRKSAC